MKYFNWPVSFSCLCIFLFACNPTERSRHQKANVLDSSKLKSSPQKNTYTSFITPSTITDEGLFKVHKLGERYLFEIPDTLLERDLLVVSRINKSAAGLRSAELGYAGDLIGESVIQFSKSPGNKLFLRTISYTEVSKDTTQNGLYRSVMNSNIQPIVAAFDITTFSPDSSAVVIDITNYIGSENDIFSFNASSRKKLSLSTLQADRSYIQNIRSFPLNIEIHSLKTYSKSDGGYATFELNNSIVLLPKEPMHPRYFDERVGYFSTGYKDFDVNPQGVENISMITRWRLEPRDEDIEKYKKGELVEPKKPIIFYIDPSTPRKWSPYLIQGVNDWQKAFEKAGFKNAIYALEAPVNDPEWSLEDARHNVIVYKPSDITNASGPHIHDPRSGEILETHVNWYHNIMQLLHDWYMVQAGAIDPAARKMEFDDSLMGKLIRFVSSHEIGHTLGLMHNFGSSSTIPVDSLRSKTWVENNGHTPSIMDYARFNYVAQPEDSISEKGIFPRIGVYDKWAIEWGYRIFYDIKSEKEEKKFLTKWITDKLSSNKRLWYGGDKYIDDPRTQAEDLGDDPVKAGIYGIKNLHRVISHLIDWTKTSGEDYSSVKRVHDEVVTQYQRYLFHAAKYIGGNLYTPKTTEQEGPVIEFTSRKMQRSALKFLQDEVFTTQEWLIDKDMFSVIGKTNFILPLSIQLAVIQKILSHTTLRSLLQFESIDSINSYKASEYLHDLSEGIWSELKSNKPIDLFRRNLQKIYTNQLISLLKDNSAASTIIDINTDMISILRAHIANLIKDINVALPAYKDINTRWHLLDVRYRLMDALDPGKK